MKEQVHSASLHFRKNAWSWNDKTVKIIVTARLAWFVGGLRSCPPLVVFCVHAILRFTSGGSLHASLRPARQVRDDEKKTDRHGEAGDASAGATKPSPSRDTPYGLFCRFSSRGLLQCWPYKPSPWAMTVIIYGFGFT